MTQLSFDQKLPQSRYETGLSLKQAAELISVDYTLSRIEKEECFPHLHSQKVFAVVYGVDYKYLQVDYLIESRLKLLEVLDY